MQKQSPKKILLTCIFTILVLLILPTQISWAGQPAQSVPTAGPSPTPIAVKPPEAAASPTPRVFLTATKAGSIQDTATPAPTSPDATTPANQSTPTNEVIQPIAASLTAVVVTAAQEKSDGGNSLPLYLFGLLLVLVLAGIFLFLRRGKH